MGQYDELNILRNTRIASWDRIKWKKLMLLSLNISLSLFKVKNTTAPLHIVNEHIS